MDTSNSASDLKERVQANVEQDSEVNYPSVAEIQNAMKSTVQKGTKSEAAYVLLKVLEKIYGDNKGILSAEEKENKTATVGKNGINFLKQFQKKYVGMSNPDGEATKNRGTWKKVLEIVEGKNSAPQQNIDIQNLQTPHVVIQQGQIVELKSQYT